MENHYKKLNLNTYASLIDIKQRYKSLALELHPDKAPGKENEFIEMQ
jgi:DnaJ-class molecular chaperone